MHRQHNKRRSSLVVGNGVGLILLVETPETPHEVVFALLGDSAV